MTSSLLANKWKVIPCGKFTIASLVVMFELDWAAAV
jgi:hypothetical protein